MAERLQIPENTVRTYYSQSLLTLRKRLRNIIIPMIILLSLINL